MGREFLRRLTSLGTAFARNTLGARQSPPTFQWVRSHQLGISIFNDTWARSGCSAFSTAAEKDAPQEDKGSADNPPNDEPKQSAEPFEDMETELPEVEPERASTGMREQLRSILEEKDAALLKLSEQLEDEKKRALSALAETENMRMRFSRESAQTKKFAVQGLVQDLLGSLDNLDRAVDSVPEDVKQRQLSDGLDQEKLQKALQALLTGVKMTQSEFRNVLQSHGVTRYDPLGEVFDPNEHMARFELDDPEKKPGTVGVVILCGYKMHDRIIRSAEVGVVRKPHEEAVPQDDEKSQAES